MRDIEIQQIEDDDHSLARCNGIGSNNKWRIGFNTKHWSDPELLKKYHNSWQGIVVDSSDRGVIIHEAGHVLYHIIENAIGSKRANNIVSTVFGINRWDRLDLSNAESPSIYGQENAYELIAEAFVAYYENTKPWGGTNNNFNAVGMAKSKDLWNQLLNAYTQKLRKNKR